MAGDASAFRDPGERAWSRTRVQLPQSLDWNVTTMVKFASGITVANGAGGGVG